MICECRSRRCRRKIRITEGEYRTLSRIGMILSADCALREERPVITTFLGYRIVPASNRGKVVV